MSDEMHRQTNMTTGAADAPQYAEDEISLQPYFEALWGYRWLIGAAVIGVGVVFAVGALLLFLKSPTERVGSIRFRLLFDGAVQNRYPNGTPFSPSEIVATPVVSEVFEANELKRFGKYEDFKDALFVQQSNPAIELLAYEYQGKLADTKLTPVDRARIEEEFKKKREAMVDPSFSLSLRRSERFTALPNKLEEKVLTDTLNTWAQQAVQRKGALKYNISALSRNVLPVDFILSEDYVIGTDILRSKVQRIIRCIDQISALPGAEIIRVGKDQVAIAEVRANLEDIVRFKLQPLVGFIRSMGLSNDQRALSIYLENQLFQIKLEQQQAASKVERLQNSLRDYVQQRGSLTMSEGRQGSGAGAGTLSATTPLMIPQFSESFLDRIVQMSTQNNDVKYRQGLTDRIIEQSLDATSLEKEQAYYDEWSRSPKQLPAASLTSKGGGSPEAVIDEVKKRFSAAIDDILTAIDQVSAIYEEISKLNLNPSTMLYAITGPFVMETQRSLSVRSVEVSFVLIMMLTLIVVPIGCLIHHGVKKHS